MVKMRLKKFGNNPYNLSQLRWVCDRCGLPVRNNSPYQPSRRGYYCNCR